MNSTNTAIMEPSRIICMRYCSGKFCPFGRRCRFHHDETLRQASLNKQQIQGSGYQAKTKSLKPEALGKICRNQAISNELIIGPAKGMTAQEVNDKNVFISEMDNHHGPILPCYVSSVLSRDNKFLYNDLSQRAETLIEALSISGVLMPESTEQLRNVTYSPPKTGGRQTNFIATSGPTSDHRRNATMAISNIVVIPKSLPKFGILPTELRLKIWGFAFQRPRCVKLKIHKINAKIDAGGYDVIVKGYKFNPLQTRSVVPSLLQVNQESRYEALKFYSLHFNTTHSKSKIYFNMEVDCLLLYTRAPEEFPLAVANLSEETINCCTTLAVRCRDYLHSPWAPVPGFCETLTTFKSLKRLILLTTEEDRNARHQFQFHGKEAEWVVKQEIREWIRDYGEQFGRKEWQCPKIYLKYG